MVFRVATTRDLLTPSGDPAFGASAFDALQANLEINWEWLPEDISEVTPEIAARYDGLHVNTPRVTAASVARDDCRLKIVARNGVGFDTVDIDACTARGITVTNTPFAVRRPVAVAALTLIFALSGRLLIKDRLVRIGQWDSRTAHMGVGLASRRLGLIGAGGIGQELIPLARPFFTEIVAADPFADPDHLTRLGARPCA
ncbi:MAG: NAD(P)-dependent oxidoreductase, partial [Pseudomonadota bacterium]